MVVLSGGTSSGIRYAPVWPGGARDHWLLLVEGGRLLSPSSSSSWCTTPPIPTAELNRIGCWDGLIVMSSVAELTDLIAAKGEEIRVLKAQGAGKDALAPLVAALLDLKERCVLLITANILKF
jgi:hypothetical protein